MHFFHLHLAPLGLAPASLFSWWIFSGVHFVFIRGPVLPRGLCVSAWVCSAADLRPQHGGRVAATAPQPGCQKEAEWLPQGPLWKNHRMFLCGSARTNYCGQTDRVFWLPSFGTEVNELRCWWLCSHYYVLCRQFPVLLFMSTHLKLLLLIRVICLAHKAFSFRSSPHRAEDSHIMHTEGPIRLFRDGMISPRCFLSLLI